MTHIKKSSWHKAVLTLTAAAALGACSQQTAGFLGQDGFPLTYEQRHPIVVGEAPTILDVPVGSKATHLTVGAQSAISGFAQEFHTAKAADIQLMVPSRSINRSAANHAARHVKQHLVDAGIEAGKIRTVSYTPENKGVPAHLRLVFLSVKAQVASECGIWESDIASKASNANYENFGCATQSNLASIIADPNDLISPRKTGPVSPENRDGILESFQAGTLPNSALSTSISPIGN